MIKPTVGRVVLFHPGINFAGARPAAGEPLPALVCRVWSDRMINIGGFDADGNPFNATSVPLMQGDEPGAPADSYAEWMPFQKAQASELQQRTRSA